MLVGRMALIQAIDG